jgi:carbon-monoxide dehydrogenase medium subunit
VKPASFDYHLAHDVAGAISLLTELGEDAKILAGGQSLVPMMNLRLARPSALIDITRIPGLSYLRAEADGLHVGALARHRTVETTRDQAVLAGFGVLPRSAHWIGHYPIRARGTFGGSIAHGDSTAEWCLLAVLLDAQIILQGPAGQRRVSAGDFFQGFFTTAAEPAEMVTEVLFTKPSPHAALTEFAQRQGDFAVVAAAVSVDLDGADGRAGNGSGGTSGTVCRSARIVLGGVSPAPFVVDTAGLAGQPASPDTWRGAGELAAAQIDPPEHEPGDAAYRRHLTATLVTRALTEAAARPRSEASTR